MASGQRLVRDAELPGFLVTIGKTTKTFMVQGDLRTGGKRQSIRVKVGEVGKLQTREARAKNVGYITRHKRLLDHLRKQH